MCNKKTRVVTADYKALRDEAKKLVAQGGASLVTLRAWKALEDRRYPEP